MTSNRELLTIEQFVSLSAKLNYQLSAQSLNKPILLALVLDQVNWSDRERDVLIEAFNVIQAGYGQHRRRLGTPGLLHPLRTAAMLSRTMTRPTLMHLLATLLHDKDEDLTRKDIDEAAWQHMQMHCERLKNKLSPEEGQQLDARIDVLSNVALPNYEAYLGRLLDNASTMPDLLHVKLMDRLDNTFDIHLQHPGISHFNFYRAVFDILFLPRFSGISMGRYHFMPGDREGVMLLSQLFKDVIFLALIRQEGLDINDPTTKRLFVGLAVAGIREAQWLALEIFNICITDVAKQRALLAEVMSYCNGGGIDEVRGEGLTGQLDGVFMAVFTAQQEGKRKELLTELFRDREQLSRLVLTFIAVFASFINDPTYTIKGLGRSGPVLETDA